MDYRASIIAQYHAALEMLKHAIVACPDPLWNSVGERSAFWQVAYHALFYTHLYLQESEQTFRPWSGHRAEYLPDRERPAEPPNKQLVLDYLAFCQRQVAERTADVALEAPSGFGWIPLNKFELQIYTIRHIQQHTGELMERLGDAIEVDWIGTYRAEP